MRSKGESRVVDDVKYNRIISELVHSIDLNTLHALSLTCSQVRANILPFRRQLIKQTVRCEYDARPLMGLPFRYRRLITILTPNINARPDNQPDLVVLRRGQCARDLVGECRRCGRVICRVSGDLKPPSSWAFEC